MQTIGYECNSEHMQKLPHTGSWSLLVRLDFADDDAWNQLVGIAEQENEDGYQAGLDFINDKTWSGSSAEQLRLAVPPGDDGASVLFAADAQTFKDPGHPVIVIDLSEEREPFRCVATELGGIEANLNIANMDWEDFSENTDADGVFRGFED